LQGAGGGPAAGARPAGMGGVFAGGRPPPPRCPPNPSPCPWLSNPAPPPPSPQVEHVKAERNVLASVHNPYVVKLFYSFQDEEFLYLVMEYLPGGDVMVCV
jgi:serine/threonine protein kinase